MLDPVFAASEATAAVSNDLKHILDPVSIGPEGTAPLNPASHQATVENVAKDQDPILMPTATESAATATSNDLESMLNPLFAQFHCFHCQTKNTTENVY